MGERNCGSCVRSSNGLGLYYPPNREQHSALPLPYSFLLVFAARLIALSKLSPLRRTFPLLPHLNATVCVISYCYIKNHKAGAVLTDPVGQKSCGSGRA